MTDFETVFRVFRFCPIQHNSRQSSLSLIISVLCIKVRSFVCYGYTIVEVICRIMGRHHKNARDVLQTSASLETAAFLKFERALFVGVKCPTAPYLMKRSVLCTALSIHLLNCQLLLQLLVISWLE